MTKTTAAAAILVAILLMAGCAPGPNTLEKTADAKGQTAGFLLGLWHGFISPVTFLVSIFTQNVRFYEVHNNGAWYNFGFVLGAGLFFSGGVLGRRKKRR